MAAAMQVQATDSDFAVPYHEPDWLELGDVAICTRCGVLSQYPAA